MVIDSRPQIRDHPLPNPADKVEARRTRYAKQGRHQNEHKEILINELDITLTDRIHHPPGRDRKSQGRQSGDNKHHEGARQHALVGQHKRDQTQDGPHSAALRPPQGFFFDRFRDRVGTLAHICPALAGLWSSQKGKQEI